MLVSPIKPKVIVVVGPTASGKSALAVDIAIQVDGEIISADSRQVYRGLDIGSGKITQEEMKNIPHHLLDVANVSETYTASNFKHDAGVAIHRICARGKVPIIAGGTFFYIDLLLGKIQNAPVPPNPTFRAECEKFSTQELYEKLQKLDKERADSIDSSNRHRLIRSLEIIEMLGKVSKLPGRTHPYDTLTIGIKIDKDNLCRQIEKRLLSRLENDLIEEVEQLLASGVSAEKLVGFGLEYRYVTEFLQQKITRTQMIELIKTKSWQYAKRQYTWLKRDRSIIWKEFPVHVDDIADELKNFL